MSEQATHHFTLDEAKRELSRRKCDRDGHDLEVIYARTPMLSQAVGTLPTTEPFGLVCLRCERSWDVSPSDR